MKRPAETAGVAAGTGGIIAALAVHNWLAAGLALVGYLPAAVTWLVAHGGIRGAVTSVWRGNRGNAGQGLIEILFALLLALIVVYVAIHLF